MLKSQITFNQKVRAFLGKNKVKFFKKMNLPTAEYSGQILSLHNKSTNYLFKEIFVHHTYYFLADNSQPFILDAGANSGFATIYFKMLYPNAEIISFEASGQTFAQLEKTIEQNKFTNVNAIHCALCDKAGEELKFYIDRADQNNLGMSLYQRDFKDYEIVKSQKLSDFINKPVDFLKLDIEGAEGMVIRELYQSGKLSMIKKGVIEFHCSPKIQGNNLDEVLTYLSKSNLKYEISSPISAPFKQSNEQTYLIFFYQN